MRKCQSCGSKKDLPNKPNSRYKDKEYYLCTPCNTQRAIRYRKTDIGRKNFSKASRTYYRRYPEKVSARIAVRKIVSQPCQVCGETKVDKHHPDYSKPLEVIFLCRTHHKEIHRLVKQSSIA